MPLVEIIRGEKTSDEALARVFDYTLAIKKTPIVVNDSRGFFTSRVIGTFVNEAIGMLAEGIEPATIEQAGLQAGYPAAPLQLSDELNLTLMQKIRKESEEAAKAAGKELPDDPAKQVINALVEGGRIGKLGGAGFYDYVDGKRAGLWQGLREHVQDQYRSRGPVPGPDRPDAVHRGDRDPEVLRRGRSHVNRRREHRLDLRHRLPAWTGGVHQFIVGYPGGQAAFVARAEELAKPTATASPRPPACGRPPHP